MTKLIDEARAILAETLRQVDVREVVRRHIAHDGEVLTLGGKSIPVADLDQVVVFAVGKAALPMHEASLEALRGLAIRCVTVTNEFEVSLEGTGSYASAPYSLLELVGSHPLPNASALRASKEMLQVLREVTERTVVLFLISGGASAMLEMPLDPQISMEDTAAFYQSLIGSGLPIAEMNALRKHFSAVKGGRLAEAAAKARIQYTMLVSDVPSGLPDAIGSGPSLPDSTTLAECRLLLRRVGGLPKSVEEFFAGPLCVETPKVGDGCFERAHWDIVLSSEHLAAAAAKAARAAGFRVEIDNGCDEWEYRDAARYLLDRGLEISGAPSRVCLISVGEVSVTLPEKVGEGGRNQQFALWCADEAARRGVAATILSVGSDGIDGNSQAAGAVCDETTPEAARQAGWSVADALAGFDAGPLLRVVGATIETGPTGNNLRDLRMLLFG
jgi:hydroxypyruvate reductase